MPQWLNSRIRGELKESDLSPTGEDARHKLRSALTRHEQRGETVRQNEDETRAGRAYWTVTAAGGETVAVYWLSDDDEGSPRP